MNDLFLSFSIVLLLVNLIVFYARSVRDYPLLKGPPGLPGAPGPDGSANLVNVCTSNCTDTVIPARPFYTIGNTTITVYVSSEISSPRAFLVLASSDEYFTSYVVLYNPVNSLNPWFNNPVGHGNQTSGLSIWGLWNSYNQTIMILVENLSHEPQTVTTQVFEMEYK